jgi:hypothetical protein
MPPPTETAVTVAPPMGTLAEFVTMPTIVPRAAAVIGVVESWVQATGTTTVADVTAKTTLCRYFAIFIVVTIP